MDRQVNKRTEKGNYQGPSRVNFESITVRGMGHVLHKTKSNDITKIQVVATNLHVSESPLLDGY